MTLSESDVQDQLDHLIKKHLVTANSGFGQRVVKYEQRFCNSAFGNLQLSSAEVAVLTLLFLRGAQTPGELRTRSGRLHEFADVSDVEQTLDTLMSRAEGPMVMRLAREPGKRESRFMHMFADEVELGALEQHPATADDAALRDRVEALEQQVADLQEQLAQLLEREQ